VDPGQGRRVAATAYPWRRASGHTGAQPRRAPGRTGDPAGGVGWKGDVECGVV